MLVARSRAGDVVAEDTVDAEMVVEVLRRWLLVLRLLAPALLELLGSVAVGGCRRCRT